jgi:hypothetical protein
VSTWFLGFRLSQPGSFWTQPKFGAMRAHTLSSFNVAYANDLLAIVDAADQKTVCYSFE